ncbi:hypothetical protein [Cytobacillus massiliigabonensis]|uniref:hypothetical protein n=1 Tax=Cytobacillus massiliigabonensis TaxID=1871011 RepID=UPI000C829160|nr:hypothetical protein [Cytobacillus massiliigabonensis]
MKKSEWSDNQLKELLSQMPKIKDERDPSEIFQNITVRMNKRKQRTWIMPTAAAALAAVLFLILVPNLFNWENTEEQASDSTKQSAASEKISMKEGVNIQEAEQNETYEDSAIPFTAEEAPEKDSEIGIRSMDIEDPETAVYEEDISGMEVLTYAIPDEKAMMAVPVSVLVTKNEDKSKFDLFEENMVNLSEREWGLSDYFPLNAEFAFDEASRELTIDFPVDHTYGDGSASEMVFSEVLSYTMTALNISKIKVTTDGKTGMELGNSGVIEEFEPEIGNHAYYLYYPNEAKKPYIVPYGEKLSSISDAFAAMKENQEKANLLASIPADINFETEENPEEKKLTIRFGEGSVINNDESTLHTIEAILLTAKDFNYQAVKLENADVDMVGRFNLDNEIKVPVAANKRSLP